MSDDEPANEADVDEANVEEPDVDQADMDEADMDEADMDEAAVPEQPRGRRRPGYLSVFGFGVLLLLCAATAAALANFRPNTTLLAWASIWLSGAAVVFTAAALFIRAPRS